MPPTASFRIELQSRDLALLEGLLESRVMTISHISRLYFSGKEEMAKKRVYKLKSAGFVSERRRQPFEPSILQLASRSLELLAKENVLGKYPRLKRAALLQRSRVSALTLQHELQILDFKAAFNAGIAATSHLHVARFTTWPLLHQFSVVHPMIRGEMLVKPDGFVRVHETEQDGRTAEHTFFLEIDRSTEDQSRVALKAEAFRQHYASGGFALQQGAAREAFRQYPFRVLMAFKTAERRNNTAERLLKNDPPILTQCLLTTSAEAMSDPLGAIWISPADYRAAIAESVFERDGARSSSIYYRQNARDEFVEQRVQKQSLF